MGGVPRALLALLTGSVVALTGLGGAPVGATGAAGSGDPVEVFVVAENPDGGLEVVTYTAPSAGAAEDLEERLEVRPEVVTAEVDTPVSAAGATDPMRHEQWALDAVSYERTWTSTTGAGVKVAVVDTGVRGDHQDLSRAVLSGVDYIAGGDGRIDPGGHGTHVAGIIAARANNGIGIAGGAPGVQILPVRVLDAQGSGSASNVAAGIIWAADHGARVINLSLGGPSPSAGMQAAIRYANSKGAVVLAASGNGALSGNTPSYPAVYTEAIAVGAVDTDRLRADYSNWGAYLDLVAPGSTILSTYGSSPTAYAWASGTSMATPYASAAAALVVAINPKLDAAGIRSKLESTATDVGAPGFDAEHGRGIVDPRAAVNAAAPKPPGWGSKGRGYWIATAAGHVRAFGDARHYGDLAGVPLGAPIVAAARTASGKGYWLAGADGAVYSFGDAPFHGSLAGRPLNSRIVGMTVTPTGGGYLLLGADGGIFTFGDARFYGSTGGIRLNAPVLDFAVTATGRGYWMVAADGGVFTFGDARFHGSTGGIALNSPAASLTAADSGQGYWVVARDGGIFAFDVPFHGSLPGIGADSVTVGARIRALPDGTGYYILGTNGSVFTFGTVRFFGSANGLHWLNPAVDLMVLE